MWRNELMRRMIAFVAIWAAFAGSVLAQDSAKKLILVAGKPSHPARMHEFNAGVQLLHKCLADTDTVDAEFVLNGWPEDESIFGPPSI